MSELSESLRLAGQSLQTANMSLTNAALEIEKLEKQISYLNSKQEKYDNLLREIKDALDKYYC